MIDYSEYEFLKVPVAERVATVTLNRPEKLNAVNAAMHHEFEQIWLDIAQDQRGQRDPAGRRRKSIFRWRRHYQP
jgi:enoyl-CoA hydratase/carnithine racemase